MSKPVQGFGHETAFVQVPHVERPEGPDSPSLAEQLASVFDQVQELYRTGWQCGVVLQSQGDRPAILFFNRADRIVTLEIDDSELPTVQGVAGTLRTAPARKN